MGVYIPDMSMPTTCAKCPLGHINAKRYAIECYAEYPTKLFDYDLARHSTNPFCPLVPVPNHGRLVDADALIEHLGDVEYKGAVKRVLIQATTIIEGDATDAERAKWVYDIEPDMFRCSKCNGFAPRNDYPFCHWCGAKMENAPTIIPAEEGE